MPTTSTAFEQQHGVEFGLVLAIEGYENLIVNRDPALAAAAWTGTDWTTAITGLVPDGQIDQKHEPFDDPLHVSRLSFEVKGQGGETLGQAAFDRGSDLQTELSADLTESSGSVQVQTTAGFPTSGTIYIGTERISYTGIADNAFLGCTRGLYAPFKADTETNQRFGQIHRIETDDLGTISPPEVGNKSRFWSGRRCGLWIHRIVGGVWDTRTEARLAYAGRLVEVLDGGVGSTSIQTESITSDLRNAVLGVGRYRATVNPVSYIEAGTKISVSDSSPPPNTGQGQGDANTLTFVSGTPGANEAAEGFYRAEEFMSVLNNWFGDIYDNGDTVVRRTLTGNERVKAQCEVDLTSKHGNQVVRCFFNSNTQIWQQLGFEVESGQGLSGERFRVIIAPDLLASTADRSGEAVASRRRWSLNLRPEFLHQDAYVQVSRFLRITRRAGSWYNNHDTAPQPYRSALDPITNWGFARIGRFLGPVEFIDDTTVRVIFTGRLTSFLIENYSLTDDNVVEPNELGEVTLEQVVAIEDSFENVFRQVIQSIDGNAYNDATWDNYPRQLAAGIPGELVGSRFEESITHITNTVGIGSVTVVIEKPTSVLDIFASELMIRQSFFVFEDGELQLSTFSSAIPALANHTINESTKVQPANQTGDTHLVTRWTTEYLVNNIKLEYERRLDGTYAKSLDLRCQPSIDAFGASRPATIKMTNLWEGSRSTRDIIEKFGKEVITRIFPLWAFPVAQIEVPIPHTLWHAVPGDTASVSDGTARNPTDGTRGLNNECATIMSHSYSLGTDGGAASGDAVLILFDRERFAQLSPANRVNSSYGVGTYTAGYDSTNDLLRILQNEYSGAVPGADVQNHEPGDLVTVIEVDPDPGTTPLSWDVEIIAIPNDDEMEIDATLTGFDTTKEYRVISRNYANASSEQKVEAYLAARQDLLIEDERKAREFSLYSSPPRQRARSGANIGLQFQLASSSDDLLEHVPSQLLMEGQPVSPALESAIARTSNALVQNYTAPSMAHMLQGTVLVGFTLNTTGYYIYEIRPFYVGVGEMVENPGKYRPLHLAPLMRAGSDGDAEIRIRTARVVPQGDSGDGLNVTHINPFSQPLTFTTASTSYVRAATQKTSPIIRPESGLTFIIVEGRHEPTVYDTEYKGLAECRMGPFENIP